MFSSPLIEMRPARATQLGPRARALRSVLVWAVGLVLASASPARGQSAAALSQAKAAWAAGRAYFNQGNYRAAMREFESGFTLSGKGGFLHNMGECARKLGAAEQAYQLYLRYLQQYPKGKHRVEALRRCQGLKRGACGGAQGPLQSPVSGAAAPKSAMAPSTAPAREASAIVISKVVLPQATATRPFPSQPLAPRPAGRAGRWYKHWGFWTAVGAVVLAGAVTSIAVVANKGRSSIPAGDWVVDLRR